MKQIRTAALSRTRAPPFTPTARFETVQLRKLPHLARCLFAELIGMSHFETGQIETSYAVLLALLDFDQVPGPNAPPKPTLRGLRTAIAQLAALRLIDVDPFVNRKAKGLFFQVQSRESVFATLNGKDRRSDKPAVEAAGGPIRQTIRQGIQEKDFNARATWSVDKSEGRARLAEARQRMAAGLREPVPKRGRRGRAKGSEESIDERKVSRGT
jgi:hypothetical protein